LRSTRRFCDAGQGSGWLLGSRRREPACEQQRSCESADKECACQHLHFSVSGEVIAGHRSGRGVCSELCALGTVMKVLTRQATMGESSAVNVYTRAALRKQYDQIALPEQTSAIFAILSIGRLLPELQRDIRCPRR
jgi:hypothetical protein